MRLIWQLLYPIAVYDLVTACLFLALPDGQALQLQGISAALTLAILTPAYLKRCGRREKRRAGSSADPAGGNGGAKSVRGAVLSAGRQAGPAALTAALLFLTGGAAAICFNDLLKLSGLMERFPGYETTNALLYAPPLWQQIALAGILVPAAEELVFRGLVYRTLRQRFRFLPAAALSSALFGFYHGSVVQGIYAFFVGMVLAYGLEVSESLAGAILVHIGANLTVILLEAAQIPQISEAPGIFLTTAAAAILLCGGIRCLSKRKKARGNAP